MGRRDPLPRETLVGVQVLVVDDDREACELFATILGYCGALVTTCTSADSGLATIARVVPDVIVCDIVMADHDGFWFLSSLRQTPGGAIVPVIAVTGYDDTHTAERTLSAGFNGHVRKPVDPWELARLVGALARGRS
ncbi:MAG TPA: response regulator [Methylomirabilota bacterium]|jgi:CheY-like chemotaxis protein|nr:response regulator [Methylomirabilota bacterium]